MRRITIYIICCCAFLLLVGVGPLAFAYVRHDASVAADDGDHLITPLFFVSSPQPASTLTSVPPTFIVPGTPVGAIPTLCHPAPTPTSAGGTGCGGSPAVFSPQATIAPTPFVGGPAIVPRTSGTDPQTPNFTADDAAAYVLAHPYFGKIDVFGPITIASVTFLPASQLSLSESYNLSDRLVCRVEATGDFRLSIPPTVNASGTVEAHSLVLQKARQIFDAHTGNLLEVGGGGS
ncbi:MAG: hypothetical protein ACR2JW_10950 [Thermomicrobiales bacterium]